VRWSVKYVNAQICVSNSELSAKASKHSTAAIKRWITLNMAVLLSNSPEFRFSETLRLFALRGLFSSLATCHSSLLLKPTTGRSSK